MKVSIIIPIYNVAPYIERCLQSVVSQTYNNIECILVDDCGTDDSCRIARDFINAYEGGISFTIISHHENQGLAAARNTGIRNASGDYLYFLDSDDAITPDCINTLIEQFHKNPDIDFAQGNYLNNNYALSQYSFKQDIPTYVNTRSDIENLMLCQIVTSACNRLLSKSFIMNNQLFFPVGLLHEDLYWIYFTTKYTRAAAYISKGLYIYYQNEDSIVTSTSNKTRIKRYQSRLKGAFDYLKDMLDNGSSIYQRLFFAVNLLCCLVELSTIKSIYHWGIFWLSICKISIKLYKKITWRRILFILCLMPPLCFFSGNKYLRWRIQHHILSQI